MRLCKAYPVEKSFLRRWHVGTSRYGFDSVHGGFDFGERNEPGKSILDFALSYDLILANTWFRKRVSLDHL